jgi:hypothetical protein
VLGWAAFAEPSLVDLCSMAFEPEAASGELEVATASCDAVCSCEPDSLGLKKN